MTRMDEPTGETYTIREPLDFLVVPAQRRGECLHEFEVWLLIHELGQASGLTSNVRDFIWSDDAKGRMDVTIRTVGDPAP